MKIRTKIILALSFAVIIAITGVSIAVSIQMKKAFVNNFSVNSEAQLKRMSSAVNIFFENVTSSANLLASSPITIEHINYLTTYTNLKGPHKYVGAELPAFERELYHELVRVKESFTAYDLVYIGNNQGGYIQAPDVDFDEAYDPSDRPWYLDAVKAGKTIVTDPYVYGDYDYAVCTVASPVRLANGAIEGVVALDIKLSSLNDELGGVAIGKTGYVLVMDATGQIVIDPKQAGSAKTEQESWLGKNLNQLPPDISSALHELQTLKNGVATVTFDDKTWLAGVQTSNNGWHLVMLQEQDEVFADAMSVTFIIMLIGLSITIVMIILAWFVAKSISSPVDVLAKASLAVANGDMQAIPVDSRHFKGELGILHGSLRRMVEKLTELINTANDKMREAEEALASAHESFEEAEQAKAKAELARRDGILQTADEIGSVIEILTESTKKLAEEAEHTSNKTAEQENMVIGTAGAVQQMHIAVAEVAQSTSLTAQLAEDSRSEAQAGKLLVLEVLNSMSEIEQKSKSMSESLSELGTQANDIGQIMNVINDIADQTNLLALNAAIEAARAGEAGRGFAVVADEVRKLAEKTMEATRQVGNAITTIQQGTTSNIEAMQESSSFISASTEVATKAGSSLEKIEEMVEKTAGEVRSIATASEQQSATAEEMSRSTEHVRELTTEVTASLQKTNQEVERLLEISNNLSSIVENLRKS